MRSAVNATGFITPEKCDAMLAGLRCCSKMPQATPDCQLAGAFNPTCFSAAACFLATTSTENPSISSLKSR